jgi:hypothetical protein
MAAESWEARTMPAQLRPIGTIAFASFLASGLGVSVPAKIAFAVTIAICCGGRPN